MKERWLLLGIGFLLLLYFITPSQEKIPPQGEGGPNDSSPFSIDIEVSRPSPPGSIAPSSDSESAPWAAFNEKGVALFNKGRYQEALDLFTQASSLRPEETTLRKNVAYTHAQLGWEAIRQSAFTDTESHFKASIKQLDGEATFYFGAAIAFRRQQKETVIHLLEEAYREIGRTFSYYPDRTILAVLYTDQQFRDVTQSPAWTKALFDGKIHLPIGGPIENEALLKKVVYHEFTHALVHQLSRGKTPTWLNEGLALYFEEGGRLDRDYRLTPPLLPLDRLHGSFMMYDEPTARQAYAESRSATAHLIDRYGFFRIKLLLEGLAEDTPFPQTFERIFLLSYADFQREWQKKMGSG